MRCRFGSDAKRGLRAERGAIAVEFAIILPVLLLLVFGIIDFGHAWYMKQIVSNASREGARYGTRSTGATAAANTLNPSISNYILNTSAENGGKGGYGLKSSAARRCNPAVPTPTGPGYTDSAVGKRPFRNGYRNQDVVGCEQVCSGDGVNLNYFVHYLYESGMRPFMKTKRDFMGRWQSFGGGPIGQHRDYLGHRHSGVGGVCRPGPGYRPLGFG